MSKTYRSKQQSNYDLLSTGVHGTQIRHPHRESTSASKPRRNVRRRFLLDNPKETDEQLGFQYSFQKDGQRPVKIVKNADSPASGSHKLDEILKHSEQEYIMRNNEFNSFQNDSHTTSNQLELKQGQYSPRIGEFIFIKGQCSRRTISIRANNQVKPSWAGGNYQSSLIARCHNTVYGGRDQKWDTVGSGFGVLRESKQLSSPLNSSLGTIGATNTGFKKQDPPPLKNKTSIGTLIGHKKALSGIHMKGKLANTLRQSQNHREDKKAKREIQAIHSGTQLISSNRTNQSNVDDIMERDSEKASQPPNIPSVRDSPSATARVEKSSMMHPSQSQNLIKVSDTGQDRAQITYEGESAITYTNGKGTVNFSIPNGQNANDTSKKSTNTPPRLRGSPELGRTGEKPHIAGGSISIQQTDKLERAQVSMEAKKGLQAYDTSTEDNKVLNEVLLINQIGKGSATEDSEDRGQGQSTTTANWQNKPQMFHPISLQEMEQGAKEYLQSKQNDSNSQQATGMSPETITKAKQKIAHAKDSQGSSQGSQVERNTYQDSMHQAQDNENQLKMLAPKFATSKPSVQDDGSAQRGELLGQTTNSSVEETFLPSYRRPTQKSAQNSRYNKLSLAGEIKGKLGITKKKEVFFGSLISCQGEPMKPLDAMSARIVTPMTGSRTIKNRRNVLSFDWQNLDGQHRETPFSSDQRATSPTNAEDVETTIKQKLNQTHNKLTKNLGIVYNKIALDEINRQKRKFADVTLKKSFYQGQGKKGQDQVRIIQQIQAQEEKLQGMDTRNFIKYLNRDIRSHQETQCPAPLQTVRVSFNLETLKRSDMKQSTSPDLKSDLRVERNDIKTFRFMQGGSKLFESARDKDDKSNAAPFSPLSLKNSSKAYAYQERTDKQDEYTNTMESSRPHQLKQQKSLNRHSFRQPLQMSKYKQHLFNTQRRDRFFINKQGISNYEYVLGGSNQAPNASKNLNSELNNFIYTDDIISPDVIDDGASYKDKTPRQDDTEEKLSLDVAHNISNQDTSKKVEQQKTWLNQQRYIEQRQQSQFHTQQQSRNMLTKNENRTSMISLEDGNIIDQQQLENKFIDKSNHSIKSDKQLAVQQLSEIQDGNIGVGQMAALDQIEKLSIKSSDLEDDYNEETIEAGGGAEGDEIDEMSQYIQGDKEQKKKVTSPHLAPRRIKFRHATAAKKEPSPAKYKSNYDEHTLEQKLKSPRPFFAAAKDARRHLKKPGLKKSKTITFEKAASVQKPKEEEMSTASQYFGTLDQQNTGMQKANADAQIVQDFIYNRPSKLQGSERTLFSDNLSSMAADIGKDIKLLLQGCERLMIAADEYPEIEINQPQGIELQPQCSLFYRVYIADLPSPLKFEIEYHGISCRLSGLEVLLSTYEKNPTYERHEVKFYAKEAFYLPTDKIGSTSTQNKLLEEQEKGSKALTAPSHGQLDNSKYFRDKYIYMNLHSYSGCSITLAVKTVASRQDANKVALRKFQEGRRQYQAEANDKLSNENDPYVKEMVVTAQMQLDNMQAFQQLVKDSGFAKMFYPNKKRQQRQFKLKNEQAKKIYENKQTIDLEEQKRKTFLLVRWLYLKRIRKHCKDKQSKWKLLLKNTKLLVQLILFHRIYSQIWERFYVHQQATYREFRVRVLTLKIKARQKNFFKRKSADINERFRNFIRQNLCCQISTIWDARYDQAAELLCSYLLDWSNYYEMREKTERTMYSVGLILKQAYEYTVREKMRAECLQTIWWDEARFQTVSIVTKSAANDKKYEKFLQAIVKISDAAKIFICTCYIKRQRINSHLRFAKWLVNQEECKRSQDPSHAYKACYFQYIKQIPIYEEFQEEMDKFLNQDVAKYKLGKAGGGPKSKSKGSDRDSAFMTQPSIKGASSPKSLSPKSSTLRKSESKASAVKLQKSNTKIGDDCKMAEDGKLCDKVGDLLRSALKAPCPTFQLLQPDYPHCIKKLVARAALIMMKTSLTALEDERFKWETIVDEHTEALGKCGNCDDDDHADCKDSDE